MRITPRPRPVALRVELRDVTPLVWRRVLVSNQWTLAALHKWLQWIMGWMDTHAHQYQVGDSIVAPDWWIHEIGNSSGPPDDVGGPHLYREFLVAIADRRHEQHEEYLRWIGGVFDPKGFDLNRLNREWKGARVRKL